MLKRSNRPIKQKLAATKAGLNAAKTVKKTAKVNKPKAKATPKTGKPVKISPQQQAEYDRRCTMHFEGWLNCWLRLAIDICRLTFIVSLGALGLLFTELRVSVFFNTPAEFALWLICAVIFTITLAWGMISPHIDKFFIQEHLLPSVAWSPEQARKVINDNNTTFWDKVLTYASRGATALCLVGAILIVVLAAQISEF